MLDLYIFCGAVSFTPNGPRSKFVSSSGDVDPSLILVVKVLNTALIPNDVANNISFINLGGSNINGIIKITSPIRLKKFSRTSPDLTKAVPIKIIGKIRIANIRSSKPPFILFI